MKKPTPAAKRPRRPKPSHVAGRPSRPSRAPTAATAPTATPPVTPFDMLREWREHQKSRQTLQAALVAFDPQIAMFVARDHLLAAIDIVSEMVERGALDPNPTTIPGAHNQPRNPVARGLASEFMLLMHQVDRCARNGYPEFMETAWKAGHLFAETVHDIALAGKQAHNLEPVARRSNYLPSLRTRQSTFTYDSRAVANRLHLAEDCLSNTAKGAKHRLDVPITNLVAAIVESIGATQEQLRAARATYQRIRAAYANPKTRAGLPPLAAALVKGTDSLTEEGYLVKHGFPAETLSYDSLPPLTKATADEWWDKAVRQEVVRRLEDNSPESTRLRQSVSYLKRYEQLADLRRRAKSALRSLARPTRQAPTPS